MRAAMNRADPKNAEIQSKLDPGGSAHGWSGDCVASFSSIGPVALQRTPVPGARSTVVLLGAFAMMAWSISTLALDGVLEINQTCAVQTGCFAGDTSGFPVTVNGSAGKSYHLTSDLVVPNENTDGIQVSADNVSIDLAGFEIRGVVVCSGVPLACLPNAGTGSGVERTSATLSGISVRNGSIRGMGNHGVLLGVQSEVMDMRVRSNRQNGISTSLGSIISNNSAYQNGTNGIEAGSSSTVSGNTASQNAENGIEALDGSTVSGNTTYQNERDGIQALTGSTVSGNAAYDNAGDGIQSAQGSTIWGNTVRLNTSFGLNLGTDSGYRENVISGNTAGTVNGPSAVNLGNNACNGGTTCP